LKERLLCACEVLPHGRMVSLLTDFNLVLAHPGQCLHRLIGVSPFGLVAWVGHILDRGGVVAVAERLLGLPGCLGHGHFERFLGGIALEIEKSWKV
jgi:hypothetical protein